MNDTGYAIWLYGSHARGVADSHSDLDIFVAKDDFTSIDDIEAGDLFERRGATLSVYTWDEIMRMAEYGSLFLQHLKLEGIPIYETPSYHGYLRKILNQLTDYKLAARDLRGFNVVLNDVEESLDNDGEEIYELSVLGTVIRHSTILGCWLLNRPSFGRLEPVSRFVQLRGIDYAVELEFSELYSFRLFVDGRVGREPLRNVSATRWLNRARHVVANVGELTNDGN